MLPFNSYKNVTGNKCMRSQRIYSIGMAANEFKYEIWILSYYNVTKNNVIYTFRLLIHFHSRRALDIKYNI